MVSCQTAATEDRMTSRFLEQIGDTQHMEDPYTDAPCGCWGLCHCGVQQCANCGHIIYRHSDDEICESRPEVSECQD